MKKRLFFFAIIGLAVACSKSSDSQMAKSSPKSDWPIYEDDYFKVSYPSGSEVHGAKDGKQDPASPGFGILPPPNAGKSLIGGFVIQPDKDSKGMLLRDGIEAEIKKNKGDRGVVLAPPQEIPVGNGRCLGTVIITPTSNCEKGAGSCFAPIYSMLCDSHNNMRYTVVTVLSSSPSRDKLSPQAQQEAAVYERILRSLEFKKT